MLKVLLWRLRYRFLGILKRAGFRGRDVWTFTYGANLDPDVLRDRKIVVLERRPFLLHDFELQFNHEVPYEQVGMASIEPRSRSSVYGALLRISHVDELRLDCQEAHAVMGEYLKVRCRSEGQRPDFYFYRSNRRRDGLLPTAGYVEKILRGYLNLSPVPVPQIQEIEMTQRLEAMVPRQPPRFFIRDYASIGRPWLGLARIYDLATTKLFTYWMDHP